MGDGQNGGWLQSHVEAPTRETFARLCEKPSCASSSLSHLTHLRKLAPHFTHVEPSPIFHPHVLLACYWSGWNDAAGFRYLLEKDYTNTARTIYLKRTTPILPMPMHTNNSLL